MPSNVDVQKLINDLNEARETIFKIATDKDWQTSDWVEIACNGGESYGQWLAKKYLDRNAKHVRGRNDKPDRS